MLWVTFAAAVAIIGVIAVGAVVGSPAKWNGGCGDDGRFYCQLTEGKVVPQPYNQRVLVPWLVHLIAGRGGLPGGFFLVNLFSLIAIAAATWVLTRRVAIGLGASIGRQKAAAATAAALALAAPMALRFTAFYPTLVDHPALALELLWLVAITHPRSWVGIAGGVLPALAILARESSIGTIAIVAGPLIFISRRHRLVALSSLAVCIPALALVLSRPALHSLSFLPFIRKNIIALFTVRVAATNLVWATMITFGLLPWIVTRAHVSLRAALRDEHTAPLIVALIAAILAPFVIVVLAGADVARYLYPAIPPTLALALGAAASEPKLDPLVGGATAATLVLARPFQVLDGSRLAYFQSFSPYYLRENRVYHRFIADLAVVVGCIASVLAVQVARRARTSRIS